MNNFFRRIHNGCCGCGCGCCGSRLIGLVRWCSQKNALAELGPQYVDNTWGAFHVEERVKSVNKLLGGQLFLQKHAEEFLCITVSRNRKPLEEFFEEFEQRGGDAQNPRANTYQRGGVLLHISVGKPILDDMGDDHLIAVVNNNLTIFANIAKNNIATVGGSSQEPVEMVFLKGETLTHDDIAHEHCTNRIRISRVWRLLVGRGGVDGKVNSFAEQTLSRGVHAQTIVETIFHALVLGGCRVQQSAEDKILITCLGGESHSLGFPAIVRCDVFDSVNAMYHKTWCGGNTW